MFEEVQLLEVVAPSGAQWAPVDWSAEDDGNLLRKAHLNHMARFGTFHQAQGTARDEATHGPTHGVMGETDTASKLGNGKPEPKLSFQAAVTQKMRVDDAVGRRQAQARRKVLELFPHLFGTGSFDFHVGDPD